MLGKRKREKAAENEASEINDDNHEVLSESDEGSDDQDSQGKHIKR